MGVVELDHLLKHPEDTTLFDVLKRADDGDFDSERLMLGLDGTSDELRLGTFDEIALTGPLEPVVARAINMYTSEERQYLLRGIRFLNAALIDLDSNELTSELAFVNSIAVSRAFNLRVQKLMHMPPPERGKAASILKNKYTMLDLLAGQCGVSEQKSTSDSLLSLIAWTGATASALALVDAIKLDKIRKDLN